MRGEVGGGGKWRPNCGEAAAHVMITIITYLGNILPFHNTLLYLHLPSSRVFTHTMKVTLKEWNAIATWHWDIPEDEVCGICRVQFDGTCPTCKFPGDDCSLRTTNLSCLIISKHD
jgi:hypothetical protein